MNTSSSHCNETTIKMTTVETTIGETTIAETTIAEMSSTKVTGLDSESQILLLVFLLFPKFVPKFFFNCNCVFKL